MSEDQQAPAKRSVDVSALEQIERRAVRVNTKLQGLRKAIDRGDMEAARNAWAQVQEMNWTNRRELLAMGVPDSILKAAGMTTYSPPDEDDIDADALDLGALRKEFGGEAA